MIFKDHFPPTQRLPESDTFRSAFNKTVSAYLAYLGKLIPDISKQTEVGLVSHQAPFMVFTFTRFFFKFKNSKYNYEGAKIFHLTYTIAYFRSCLSLASFSSLSSPSWKIMNL